MLALKTLHRCGPTGTNKRREFITLLGGGSVVWPLVARAQQPPMPVVGFLHGASPGPFTRFVAAFRDGLKDNGFVEGQNLTFQFRWDRVNMISCQRLPPIWSTNMFP